MKSSSETDAPEHILLVDDSSSNLVLLTRILTHHGLNVESVTDGYKAIQAAQSTLPDLILMDVNLPGLDGYETCRRLKSDPRTEEIPVVFISALGDTKDKVRGLEAGGIDYISKPFQVEEVLARVQNHLTIHNLQLKLKAANLKLASDVDKLIQIEAAEHSQRVLSETFREVATTISSNLDEDTILDMILFETGNLIAYDAVSISMIEETGISRLKRYMGSKTYTSNFDSFSSNLPLDEVASLRYMAETGLPYLLTDTDHKLDYINLPGKEWLKSYLAAPICIKGMVIGFIHLQSSRPGFFKPEHIDILSSFASQAGFAIENARLYSDAQRRVTELSILNEISQLISSTTNLAHVTEMVYQQVNRLVDAYIFMVGVFHAEKDEWESIYIRKNGVLLDNFLLKTREGIGGYVIRTRKPVFLNSSKAIDEFIEQTGREPILISRPCSIMMVPLIFSNKVIGTMGVQHDFVEKAFTQNDFILFNSIASQVAIWIENARLFSEMEKLAITDTLTGINNRRQILNLAQQELERATRYGHDLSILIMDIDHFKHVNDDFGHPAGDEVLCGLTRLCTQHLRMVDTIGRYGGEEFMILMPETSHRDAAEAATRLLKHIEKMEFNFEGKSLSITASIGMTSVGAFRKENWKLNLEAIIKRADEALYQAKSTGRNKVCC